MARPIVLSNGELHIGINKYGLVHDFYYPYVGLENHVAGRSLRHKIGVWINGQMSWLDRDGWTFDFRYPAHVLIGKTIATNDALGIRLEFDDAVDSHMNAFMRNIQVINLRDSAREIRLFMNQVFAIGDSRSNTDTAQYLPKSEAILHYRGRRAFIISGCSGKDKRVFDQYTVGLFGIEGHEGSFRDAEDGELAGGNVEHGRVDSVLRFTLDVEAHGSERVHYWIAAGTSMRSAVKVHKQLKKDGLEKRLHDTAGWWQQWMKPAQNLATKIAPDHQDLFLKSVMIIKSQIDKRGAVIASTDTTMLNYARDAYGYCWPRDGALTLWPLIRMGYKEEPRRFFEFCRRGLHDEGYLMHKYRADGALGSSWHPYIRDGEYARPIQEDETALTLFVFGQFYQAQRDPQLLDEFYGSFIVPMANFLASFVDKSTGLPSPSYDLWEENYMTTTYSTAATYAALMAATELAEAMKDADHSVKWRLAAEEIFSAADKELYNTERNAFYKGVIKHGKQTKTDQTLDLSSFFGAFMFGLSPIGDERLLQAHETIVQTFGLTDDVIGLPRYEHDNYQRKADAPPNHWFITTLWLAQYHLEINERDKAFRALDWVKSHASSTGIMSEQLDPKTGERVSVEPLTWSHAEYVATLLDSITESEAS